MPTVAIDRVRIPNDETLLPLLREEVFLRNEYRQAFIAYGGWGDFPPVTVDQDYLILDGVTRILAAQEAGVSEVEVLVVNCSTVEERLRIAARGNATHGKRWESRDIVKLANLADRFGIPRDELASDLRIPVTKIERIPVATAIRTTVSGEKERELVYLKRPVRQALSGRELTPRQEWLMEELSTASMADVVLADFVRLANLEALPTMNEKSRETAEAAKVAIDEWIARDQHLLEVPAAEPTSLDRLWKSQATPKLD